MSTAETPEIPVCSSRSCDQPAAGVGPFSGLSLCQSHLDRDVLMVETRKTELLNKLQMVMDPEHRAALRAEQSSLAAEVQQVIDMFDAVQEKLQQWRDRAVSRVQAVHDSVARRLRDSAEAEECSKEASLACDAGEMRRVMELTVSLQSWLDEANGCMNEFERVCTELRTRQGITHEQLGDISLRSVGDVAAGVQQLQFMVDRHMADVMQQCWLDEGEASADPPPVCRSVASISDLPADPMYLASCTNTAGFVSDASERVIRAESGAEDCVPLPQPCLFVSFKPSSAVNHLLVTSLDGAVRLQFQCSLDWKKWIFGIHCDSKRQQLFIAQQDAVTVTDLSGQVIREIKSSSLGQPPFDITRIDGNADKVLVLGNHWISRFITGIDGNADKEFVVGNHVRKIAAIGKDSGDTEFELDLANLPVVNRYGFCLHGSKILLVDDKCGRVLSVCAISGQLIGCFPTQRSGFERFDRPWDVTIDSRGLIFVCEGHTVRILTSDGSVVRTLGTAGQSGTVDEAFNRKAGLAVIEHGCLEHVVVADSGNRRLRTFELL